MNGQVLKAAVATVFILCLSAISQGQSAGSQPATAGTPRPFFIPESVAMPLSPQATAQNSIPDPVPDTTQETAAPVVEATPAPQVENSQVNPKNFYATLRQIDVDGKRAVAMGGWEVTKLQVGAQLVAQADGRNCFLVVTSVNGNIAQLDASRCAFLEQLRVGQALEPSLFENPRPVPYHERFSIVNPEERDHRLRYAVSIYYGFGNSLDSDNLSYLQGGQPAVPGSGSITTSTAPGVAVEVYQDPENSFGWSGGVSYDFQRTVTGLNAYANGTYIGGPFNSPSPTLSLLTVYGNFIFRADKFYFPVGLNYTFPSFSGGANSFGNTTLVGGGGLQLAAGYLISDHVAAEIWIQSLSLDGSTVTPYGTITYNGLNFTNSQLRLRFSF